MYKTPLELTERQKTLFKNIINNPFINDYIFINPQQLLKDKHCIMLNKSQLQKLKSNKKTKIRLTKNWINQNKKCIKEIFKNNIDKNIIKFHPLSTDEIEKYLGDIGNFQGVYPKDDLPDIQGSGVINLDNKGNAGTHWCAWYEMPKYIYYFDSFGMPPPENFLETVNKPVKYTNNEIQKEDSIMCGWYCIYFIRSLYNGVNIYDFLYEFDVEPTDKNEQLIQLYAKNYLLSLNNSS